jgi:hypothetical protein
MSFTLLIMGAILLIAAIRNTQDSLFTLVRGDFTGPKNYVYWALSILVIGAVGYIPKLKPISVGFLTLVILALVISRGDPSKASGGFFQKFFSQIQSTTTTPSSSTAATPAAAGPLGQFQLPSLNGQTLPIP